MSGKVCTSATIQIRQPIPQLRPPCRYFDHLLFFSPANLPIMADSHKSASGSGDKSVQVKLVLLGQSVSQFPAT
jgi:hypothetical protein